MKLGLGESYEKVDVLPVKMRGWLDLTKPASSIGVSGAFFLASLFYFYYIGESGLIGDKFTSILYAVLTVGLAHGASQAMNMAEDADIDRLTPHKQDRPIPAGIVTEDEARTLAWFLIMFALARAYLVNNQFGLVMTITIIFGVFYNLSPIRAKERIISIPWQAVSRGLFMFPVVWAAYGDVFSLTPWVLGVFMFFYVLGFQNTADIIDRKVDAEHDISTFVVEFGVPQTNFIASGSTLLMIATIILAVQYSLLAPMFLSMLLIIPFCGVMLYHMIKYPYKLDERTGNHPAWLWYYAGMMLCTVIPLLAAVVKQ